MQVNKLFGRKNYEKNWEEEAKMGRGEDKQQGAWVN